MTTATTLKTVNIYKYLCGIVEKQKGLLVSFKTDLHEHDREAIANYTTNQQAIWAVYESGTRLNIVPNSYQWDETPNKELLFDPKSPYATGILNGFHWGVSSLSHTEAEYGRRFIKPQYYKLSFTKRNFGIVEKIKYSEAFALADPLDKVAEFWFRLGHQAYVYGGGLTIEKILENLNINQMLFSDMRKERWFNLSQQAFYWGRLYAHELSPERLSSRLAWKYYADRYKSQIK